MSEELNYIKDAFTKTEENVNLEVDNLNATCITSRNNNFHLDSDGNLTVKSITLTEGTIDNQSIMNFIYPVGSIYMSVSDVDPNMIFGGVWEQIKDRFLLACGETYENGTTGGEATHKLTIDEMPKHTHTYNGFPNGSGIVWKDPYRKLVYQINDTNPYPNQDGLSYTGNNQPHNNMPPYLSVSVWKRTA